MTSLLMSYPPISISHRLFPCKYSNSRDVIATSPSFPRAPPPPPPPPPARALRRAGSRAIIIRQDKAAFETSFNKKKKTHTHTQTHNEELFQFLITLSYKYGLEIDLSNIAGTVTSTPVSKRMLCVSHLSYSCQGEKKL